MGAGAVDRAVADAGPVIHLVEIGHLHLLVALSEVVVPDMVWAETVGRGRVAEHALTALAPITRHASESGAVSAFRDFNGLNHLQAGELHALHACRTVGTDIILTDDLAVRRAADKFGITPVGSVGIVARAYRQGLIPLSEAELTINQLYRTSSLFVTRAIVELAIEQLRRHGAGQHPVE